MSTNNYKINNVTITTNGRNELYFDVECEGDRNIDYYELRIWEVGEDNCLEFCDFPQHHHTITVKDFYFIKNWESKKINKTRFSVEIGIPDYADDGKLNSWTALASSGPIEIDLYYEFHIFRKNVLQIR